MPVLKSLSFAALPKPTTDATQVRREKLIGRLEEQKALLDNPNLIRTIQRSIKENGEKRIVSKQHKVRPWWRSDSAGQLFMSIRFGGRPVEFEKGKSAVSVPSKEKLPTVITTLIEAVRAGELDDVLAQASKGRGFLKNRKAA